MSKNLDKYILAPHTCYNCKAKDITCDGWGLVMVSCCCDKYIDADSLKYYEFLNKINADCDVPGFYL